MECKHRLNGANTLLIVGAGGHGKVVADMAMSAGHKVIGFVDDMASESPMISTQSYQGCLLYTSRCV